MDDEDFNEFEEPTAEDRLLANRQEAQRAVDEGGGGESEGFELAEQELIEHASHGDDHGTTIIFQDARDEAEESTESYGEADGDREE